ncbi:MAG: hypothetical protein IH827_10020, partial [Myxococcales bacterium]|nr:hypothetical protein [Myxococcales bacterium]
MRAATRVVLCLAALLAENGHPVHLWVYEPELVGEILTKRENTLYLPGVTLSPLITPTSSMEEALKSATLIILAVPSPVVRGVLRQAVPYLPEGFSPKGLSHEGLSPLGLPIVCVSKGIE